MQVFAPDPLRPQASGAFHNISWSDVLTATSQPFELPSGTKVGWGRPEKNKGNLEQFPAI